MKSIFNKINAKLNAQGGFLKAVTLLMTGTVFAQGIVFLALPFVTRLYTPDDFSKFAVFTAIFSILTTIGCLRYELAIPLAKRDNDAFHLLIICLVISFLFSLITLFFLIIFGGLLLKILNQPNFIALIWLVPLAIFSSSIYSALKYYVTRKHDFKLIAQTKISQGLSTVIIQVGGGWLNYGVIALAFAQIIGSSAGVRVLIKRSWSDFKKYWSKISTLKLKRNLLVHKNFPKYSATEALLNTAGIHVPILIIATAVSKEAGFLLLATRIMIIPMGLIGSAVSQVYYAHASAAKNLSVLSNLTIKSIRDLIKLGVGPILIIGIISPKIFPIIFGKEWERSGELILWMTPWFIMQFIVSPISLVLHVRNRQKDALLLQLLGFILKVGLVLSAILINKDYVVEIYALSGFLYYLFYLVFISSVLEERKIYLKFFDKKIFLILSFWLFGGGLILLAFNYVNRFLAF